MTHELEREQAMNDRLVEACLLSVWEERVELFQKSPGADNWNRMLEIMGARQMWMTGMSVQRKNDMARLLITNHFISNWVPKLADMNKDRGVELGLDEE